MYKSSLINIQSIAGHGLQIPNNILDPEKTVSYRISFLQF